MSVGSSNSPSTRTKYFVSPTLMEPPGMFTFSFWIASITSLSSTP